MKLDTSELASVSLKNGHKSRTSSRETPWSSVEVTDQTSFGAPSVDLSLHMYFLYCILALRNIGVNAIRQRIFTQVCNAGTVLEMWLI